MPSEMIDLLDQDESRHLEIGYWEWDIARDKIATAGQTANYFGVDDDTSCEPGLSIFVKAIHPDDREAVLTKLTQCCAAGGPFAMMYRIELSPRNLRWVLAKGIFQPDETGVVRRGRGIILDVTRGCREGAWIPSPNSQGRQVVRVPSAEFVRNFSAFCDRAITMPVVLTRNGRDRLVVLPLKSN